MTQIIPSDSENERQRASAGFRGSRGLTFAERGPALAVLAVWGALFSPRVASAQAPAESREATGPTRSQCIDAHRNAQEFKATGKLLEAREELTVCSSAGCPGALIVDCGGWIAELEQNTPSLVFDVTLDGKPVGDAELFVNDVRMADTAQALKLNPGRHTVRVALRDFEPRVEELVLAEGMRARMVTIAFETPQAEAPATIEPAPSLTPIAPTPLEPPVRSRPTPVLVYPLLGLGAVGLAGFGVFSLLGKSKQGDLEKQCEPSCTDDDLAPMKTSYLVGDVSAGVGAAALILAGVVYFTRPEEKSGGTTTPRIAVVPATQEAMNVGAWSVVVTQAW